jgi:hypothetical protein
MIVTCELHPVAIEDPLYSMIRPANERLPRRWRSLYPGQVDRLNGPASQIGIRNKSHQDYRSNERGGGSDTNLSISLISLQLVDFASNLLYTYESAFRKRFQIPWILSDRNRLQQ